MNLVVYILMLLGTLTVGCRIGWLLQYQVTNRKIPTRLELMGWLYQGPFCWIILDKNNRVKYLSNKAESILRLQLSDQQPLLLEQLSIGTLLTDLVNACRGRQHPLKIDMDYGGQYLEVYAFAGKRDSVALLLQSSRSLEAQLRQQERWVSDVAHELKTPLTALLLVGDSLAATATDQNAVLVERLQRELERMRDMVLDLLELSRLENVLPGQGSDQPGVNVSRLISDAWTGLKPLAERKRVSLSIKISGEKTFPTVIPGDKQRLHRALLNIIDNSLRYSPEGGIIYIDLKANNESVQIGIRDEGPGLSDEDLEHMFERFYRGDTSRYRTQKSGSGLGLAIVQQIILTHGGLIFGENDPVGGARFEIRLPLKSKVS